MVWYNGAGVSLHIKIGMLVGLEPSDRVFRGGLVASRIAGVPSRFSSVSIAPFTYGGTCAVPLACLFNSTGLHCPASALYQTGKLEDESRWQ